MDSTYIRSPLSINILYYPLTRVQLLAGGVSDRGSAPEASVPGQGVTTSTVSRSVIAVGW